MLLLRELNLRYHSHESTLTILIPIKIATISSKCNGENAHENVREDLHLDRDWTGMQMMQSRYEDEVEEPRHTIRKAMVTNPADDSRKNCLATK